MDRVRCGPMPMVHLAKAVETIAAWDPPMRFNDTTRYYFEKMATVSSPEEAARFKGLFDSQKAPAVREYLAEHDPISYSMLHTSISPNIIKGGYQVNVIPSKPKRRSTSARCRTRTLRRSMT